MTIDEIKKHVSITEIKGDCVRVKPNDGYMLKLGDFYTDELYCGKSAIPDDLTIVTYNTYFIENNKEKFKGKTVGEAKKMLIADIEAYDTSSAVNSFVLNGAEVWLDFELRDRVYQGNERLQRIGRTDTTLWLGNKCYNLSIEQAQNIISHIEAYAKDCYNVTAAHKKAVGELTDIGEVLSYDYTKGYPEKLTMTV